MPLKEQLETAMAHQVAGRLSDAEVIYRKILEDQPVQPDAIHLLGLVRAEQGRDDEAVSLMEKALSIFPQAAHFHHNIAGIYRRMGRLDEAESQFRQAIDLKPDYGEAYQGLAEMVKFAAGDPLITRIGEQLARDGLEDVLSSYFHFAAGKILDDVGEYGQAFRHFSEGNRLTHRNFDTAEFRRLVKDVLYVFSRELAQRTAGSGIDSDIPVFIVGMPRSGTTLIEQILASHSRVFGAGELNDMKLIAATAARVSVFKQTYPNCIPGLRKKDYQGLSQEYLNRLTAIAADPTVSRIIDKHPLNFQFVGLIYSLFPKARIIHTIRNPLDTCLSCFFQNFTKGQDYSFDLKTLAYFYNDYRRLMEHWETVYPGRMYSVRYEDVIADQQTETEKLLEFLGLEFEEACMEFHKTDRKVSTASFLQVRKPLYQTSQKRWMNYRDELQELATIIGLKTEVPVTISGRRNRPSSILS
ncbi:MAG: tetratricopeptide repeat protein [Gammaproteobacteria bacterium]|jgi:tetratricopeptide (TPR) repeat protein|nr:tetratricopeptide repeat protein [Gammaproteobacteria bacterium]MBT4491613.1 tetratricopeptide repeat protein [Gammaproteobacteria bacterium]MBT7370809.1 tetratricopeptide repeat protein [Gammaproteobacteria bacterium]